MDQTVKRRHFLHWLFEVGIMGKGINGFFQLVGGVLLLLVTPEQLSGIIVFVTQYEFSEDPTDIVSATLLNFVGHLQIGTKIFGAVYLLAHGFLNIFLAYHLYRERLWVFPVAIGVIEVFVLYQIYRIGIHHSVGLMAITTFDILFIGFIWNEWRTRRRMIITVPRTAC